MSVTPIVMCIHFGRREGESLRVRRQHGHARDLMRLEELLSAHVTVKPNAPRLCGIEMRPQVCLHGLPTADPPILPEDVQLCGVARFENFRPRLDERHNALFGCKRPGEHHHVRAPCNTAVAYLLDGIVEDRATAARDSEQVASPLRGITTHRAPAVRTSQSGPLEPE